MVIRSCLCGDVRAEREKQERRHTLRRAPRMMTYSWFLGSVCTSMRSPQQGAFIEKFQILVEK